MTADTTPGPQDAGDREALIEAVEFAIYRYGDANARAAERAAPYVIKAFEEAGWRPPEARSATGEGETLREAASALRGLFLVDYVDTISGRYHMDDLARAALAQPGDTQQYCGQCRSFSYGVSSCSAPDCPMVPAPALPEGAVGLSAEALVLAAIALEGCFGSDLDFTERAEIVVRSYLAAAPSRGLDEGGR